MRSLIGAVSGRRTKFVVAVVCVLLAGGLASHKLLAMAGTFSVLAVRRWSS